MTIELAPWSTFDEEGERSGADELTQRESVFLVLFPIGLATTYTIAVLALANVF